MPSLNCDINDLFGPTEASSSFCHNNDLIGTIPTPPRPISFSFENLNMVLWLEGPESSIIKVKVKEYIPKTPLAWKKLPKKAILLIYAMKSKSVAKINAIIAFPTSVKIHFVCFTVNGSFRITTHLFRQFVRFSQGNSTLCVYTRYRLPVYFGPYTHIQLLALSKQPVNVKEQKCDFKAQRDRGSERGWRELQYTHSLSLSLSLAREVRHLSKFNTGHAAVTSHWPFVCYPFWAIPGFNDFQFFCALLQGNVCVTCIVLFQLWLAPE